jgi:hypothetical protein
MKTLTGDWSTGYWSTGNWSTGNHSTGDRSTGDWSTGCRSTGNRSTGYRSTGNHSTGDRSTGDWSISNYSTGHFSTEDYSGFGAFDKPCTLEEWENAVKPPFLYFDLTEWINEEKMTAQEKEEHPSYKTTGGYLKVYDYQDAWRKSWEDAKAGKQYTPLKEQLKQLKALPNFDKDKFKQISGIDIDEDSDDSVDIDGTEISKETIKALIRKFGKELK